jgi:DNA-binding NtrC family response regulator
MPPSEPSDLRPAGASSDPALPEDVRRYLQDSCVVARAPAFLRFDAESRLLAWGGDATRYGLSAPRAGLPADDLDFLTGLLPVRAGSLALPFMEVAPGIKADLHLLPASDGGAWVVLLDATDAARRQAEWQQYAHDLALTLARMPTAARPRAAAPETIAPADGTPPGQYGMVGRSPAMREVFRLIADLAAVDSTVLIHGETGTGKELVARAIHLSGRRHDKPLVVVNCAGLSDSLINSQLFGHKRGAFTDAVSDQKGFFEAAHGGTILLDEIGDIPMNTQTRILRVLEQREVIRIGETIPRPVDVRILAATHRSLGEEVREGRFREDLLYRIRVARLEIPPLRERRQDIPPLAAAFLAQGRETTRKPIRAIGEEAATILLAHSWPGNVRELRNAIEFAMIRCKSDTLSPADLPSELTAAPATARTAPPDGPAVSQRQLILDALRDAGGRRDHAARRLGISRATLYRRMAACGLDPRER